VFFGGWWAGPLGGGYIMQIILAILGGGLFSWICKRFSVTSEKLDEREEKARSAGASPGAEVGEDDSKWFVD
jgi:hypothetical protein